MSNSNISRAVYRSCIYSSAYCNFKQRTWILTLGSFYIDAQRENNSHIFWWRKLYARFFVNSSLQFSIAGKLSQNIPEDEFINYAPWFLGCCFLRAVGSKQFTYILVMGALGIAISDRELVFWLTVHFASMDREEILFIYFGGESCIWKSLIENRE